MKILVDGDGCPTAVKELIFKSVYRRYFKLIVVANRYIQVPLLEQVQGIVVGAGPDVADDRIVELVEPGDLVIAADIPLADRAIKKGALVLNHHGDLLDEESIGQRLAMRNLMTDLRNEGIMTGGSGAYSNKDKQKFANQLDRFLTKNFKPY